MCIERKNMKISKKKQTLSNAKGPMAGSSVATAD